MSDYQADLQERVRAKTAQRGEAAPGQVHAPPHPLVAMQRHVGNAQVARMLAQRVEDDQLQAKHDAVQREEEDEEIQAKHDDVQREEDDEEIQAKHDSVQREEEDEEVQAKHDLRRVEEEDELQAKHDTVQREEEDEEIQAKHDVSRQTIGLEGGPVGDEMAGEINSLRGGGSSLDSGVRSQVEGALGADLGDVRVHQDSQSDKLNRSMTAKAFTTGSDIFLRNDVSASDTSLMAHELTHVVQQGSGAVSGGGGMSVGAADDSKEHEADAVADAITSGAAQRKQEETSAV